MADSLMSILSLAQEWQTLIVGLIGFTGVIFSLITNARLDRRQRREERRYARKPLRALLISELKINREVFVEYANNNDQSKNRKSEETVFLVPTYVMDDAYEALLEKVGSLSDNEVSEVMNAYLSIRAYYAKLPLISTPIPEDPGHVQVLSRWNELMSGASRNLLVPIDAAIEALEKNFERDKR